MQIKIKGKNFDIIIEGKDEKEIQDKTQFINELIENAYYGAVTTCVDAETAPFEILPEEKKEMEEIRNEIYKEARKIKEGIKRERDRIYKETN